MAQKRMFDKSVIRRDDFIEMPDSTQNLYFHLSMDADDDGFVDNWKSIMRMTGKKEDDMKLLIAKNFVIPFDTGVIVIKHWRLNNYLRKDRYTETKYLKEKSNLIIGENEEYSLGIPVGIPVGNPDKNSIDKNSIDNIKENKENVIEYFSNNIHSITPIEYQKLEYWLNEFNEDIIKKAIDISVINGKRSLAYIEAILKSWKQKGYKILIDIEQEVKSKNNKDAIIPSWLGKEIKEEENDDFKISDEDKKRFGIE